jgi:alpha-beta hydrolase superfamily lysophospholipase
MTSPARGTKHGTSSTAASAADGGWPMTFDDVKAAGRDVEGPLVTLGHSAGGHLAALARGRARRAALAISQAGIVDLVEAWRLGLSRSARASCLGGAPTRSRPYAAASPAAQLPLGVLTASGARPPRRYGALPR